MLKRQEFRPPRLAHLLQQTVTLYGRAVRLLGGHAVELRCAVTVYSHTVRSRCGVMVYNRTVGSRYEATLYDVTHTVQ